LSDALVGVHSREADVALNLADGCANPEITFNSLCAIGTDFDTRSPEERNSGFHHAPFTVPLALYLSRPG